MGGLAKYVSYIYYLAVRLKKLKMKKNTIIIALFLFPKLIAQETKMHITEQLLYGTIRIEAVNGNKITTGTGFFFTFFNDTEKKEQIPVIITNKHVLNGSLKIKLLFKKGKNKEPDYNEPLHLVEISNNSTFVIQHPNENVDLVAIPLKYILTELKKKNVEVFYISTSEERIPNEENQRKDLKSIENVWMIGYPKGLWDEKNNLPITRQGITATNPYVDYNGKKEFLIDMPVYGGSSGSPIFFYRDLYTDKETYVAMYGAKLYLLGILYAGPNYDINGNVVKINPNEIGENVISKVPMNLGIVIKSIELLEFKKILQKK